MIDTLTLKNFTSFEDLEIKFSPKVNVIIGENGTGKTHILKSAYAMCQGMAILAKETDKEDCAKALTDNLLRLFLPLENKLGKLHRNGSEQPTSLQVSLFAGPKYSISFGASHKTVKFKKDQSLETTYGQPVFIPTKEVLSFMKGFLSLYERYGLSFDKTYSDICQSLDLPELRSEHIQEKAKWAIEEIEKICGGKFIFYGGGKVTFKANKSEYSANTIAEGFRKIGMLARLLETGAIQPGVSGPLFWDEPESNINPKLMRTLVTILLELSRNGQQVILATHDYVFLKCFDQLMDKGKDDHVRFHSLYRNPSGAGIRIASTDDYLQISPNPIDDAFGSLVDLEIERDMGGLGK